MYNTQQLIGVMAGFKYGVTRWLILHTNMVVAWMFNVTASLALVAASSGAAVHYAPAAIGSGVPEVMAYLNGVMMPKVGGSCEHCRQGLGAWKGTGRGLRV